MTRMGGLAVVSGLFFLVILALGLVYAYRVQTPAIPAVPYAAVLGELEQGRVRTVDVEGGRATVTLVDGTRQQTTVPDNGQSGQSLMQAVAERNRADPARPVELRFSSGSPPNSGLAIVYLLPVLFFLAFPLLYVARSWRARSSPPYEALSRLADLRDRGILTEDEFLREKRRLLR